MVEKFSVNLNESEARKRLKYLANEIKKHDQLYYLDSKPLITDKEYDELRKYNDQLEKEFPHLILSDSPNARVGIEGKSTFEKTSHDVPMLSLDNAFDDTDIKKFDERVKRFLGMDVSKSIEYVAEPKNDGVSASLVYDSGKLVRGLTRGDGTVGEDVTLNLLTIKSIPRNLKEGKIPKLIEVRGEVYINKDDFLSINQENKKLERPSFANPRNAASGALRQINPKETARRPLRFVAHGWGSISPNIIVSQIDGLQKLKKWGFKINPLSVTKKGPVDLLTYYNKIAKIRSELKYEIDGIVYKVNKIDLQNRLGNSARAPRWALAHKFPAEQVETFLEKIEIQVGRTGALTPVAKLKSIKVGGAKVSKATLHNEDEIEKKDIREGDYVYVERAGDVIPKVVKVNKSKRGKKNLPKFHFPKVCPICESRATREKNLETGKEDAIRRCTGSFSCNAQAFENLLHFVSKSAFDINGLGEKQLKMFWEDGLIKKPADIFLLERKNKKINYVLASREGWGELSSKNLFNAIQSRREISFDRLLYSLGIRHIGLENAKLFAKTYITIDEFLKSINHAITNNNEALENLLAIDGIGQKVSYSLLNFFRNKKNINEVNRLLKEITVVPYKIKVKQSLFSGKILIFTGELKKMTRIEAKSLAEKLGAKTTSTVTNRTDFVIAGNKPGSKFKKAQELGIRIIDEKIWLEKTKNS